MTKDFWDERYGQSDFAYGETPNEFLKEQLTPLQAGSILCPAEGEGRNAVFAATLGWNVSAFDMSKEGKTKAQFLAQKNKVTINYQVGEFQHLNFMPNAFDAIAMIYAHFPAEKKSAYHSILNSYLKQGGIVIFEAFSKNNLDYVSINPKIGGPKDLDMLFSIEEIKSDFKDFDCLLLEEKEVTLAEGKFHNGLGSVIRFVGKKK